MIKYRLIRLMIGLPPMFYCMSEWSMWLPYLFRCFVVLVGAYIGLSVIQKSNSHLVP